MAKNSSKRADKVIPIPVGNAAKYFSYRKAWGQIPRAIGHGFYSEAVVLEESIISDRLISYFRKTGVLDRDSNKFISFARLIELLKKHVPEPIRDPIREPRFENLQMSLDEWREKRNHVIHGSVKSSGSSLDDAENFREESRQIAIEGKQIAESVCNWYRRFKDREKTKAKRLACLHAAEKK